MCPRASRTWSANIEEAERFTADIYERPKLICVGVVAWSVALAGSPVLAGKGLRTCSSPELEKTYDTLGPSPQRSTLQPEKIAYIHSSFEILNITSHLH